MEYVSQSQPFKSTRQVALWTMLLLGFLAMLEGINIVANAVELFLVSQHPETVASSLSDSDADFTEMPGGTLQVAVGLIALGVGGFSFLAYLATVVVFLIWMHRSYGNLKSLGISNTEYSPGWAVGSWFVPFVNLVRPYGITKEIWFGSDPDDVNTEGSPLGSTLQMAKIVTPMFGLWWAMWIISNIFNNISTRWSFRSSTLDDHVTSFWLAIIASVLTIVAAILAISVVNAITKRQEEKYKRLMAASPPTTNPYGALPPSMYPPSYA
ncbi:MAG: DUF4328 domain-containing protein [Acidobacteria bacterium]|nr:DUF4328 domain-containing protein [Acidobacteriota bacterium]